MARYFKETGMNLSQVFHMVFLCTTPVVMIPCIAQSKFISPNIIKLFSEKKLAVYNRNISLLTDVQHSNGLHVDEKPGDGVVWLGNAHFTTGTIEFDVKGKDLLQQSFVGIAFHGANDSTYDAIYFRPFNFKSNDTVRRSHCVQYISLPAYDWQKLRNETPNKYEQAVNPPPEPNDWFHARIVIKGFQVSVYVNNNSSPSLVITELNTRTDGKIGFLTGNNSGGDFANLKMNAIH